MQPVNYDFCLGKSARNIPLGLTNPGDAQEDPLEFLGKFVYFKEGGALDQYELFVTIAKKKSRITEIGVKRRGVRSRQTQHIPWKSFRISEEILDIYTEISHIGPPAIILQRGVAHFGAVCYSLDAAQAMDL